MFGKQEITLAAALAIAACELLQTTTLLELSANRPAGDGLFRMPVPDAVNAEWLNSGLTRIQRFRPDPFLTLR